MAYKKTDLYLLLMNADLGSSTAEKDSQLQAARVDVPVLVDVLRDRVDLIVGPKGSGKSAIFRFVVDSTSMMPDRLIAHGVEASGDDVMRAHQSLGLEGLSEDDFVDYWCVYLLSLARAQALGRQARSVKLNDSDRLRSFLADYQKAGLPTLDTKRNLRESLEAWAKRIRIRPLVRYQSTTGSLDFSFEGALDETINPPTSSERRTATPIPASVGRLMRALDELLGRSNLSLWLMVDRLDEVFPRRSPLEARALRALLRALSVFNFDNIRVKVFLRADILDEITAAPAGFTNLDHITSNQRILGGWTQEDVLVLVVKRFFAQADISNFFKVDRNRLDGDATYRKACFGLLFPPTLAMQGKPRATLKWIHENLMDGNRVVTPRDVVDFLQFARQRQLTDLTHDWTGVADTLIGADAIRQAYRDVSDLKRRTLLSAEFPHLWVHIQKFIGQGHKWEEARIRRELGRDADGIIPRLVHVGVLQRQRTKTGNVHYVFPPLYRAGLELVQRLERATPEPLVLMR